MERYGAFLDATGEPNFVLCFVCSSKHEILSPTPICLLRHLSQWVVSAACLDHLSTPAGQCPPRRLSNMSRAQIPALVFGIGGFGALVAAVISNEWKVTTRASSVITATWVYQGLWMNCAGNALGSFHCRPHFTIFKVEGKCNALFGAERKWCLPLPDAAPLSPTSPAPC